MAKSFKDKAAAPGVYSSIIGSAQNTQQEHKAQPKNYRFNLNMPIQYKDYLQEIAWENRVTITEYICKLIAEDAERNKDVYNRTSTQDTKNTQDT